MSLIVLDESNPPYALENYSDKNELKKTVKTNDSI
jgi:hypothetical protein